MNITRKHLPQFHLRDLFWLILLVGTNLAWWLDHRAREQAALRNELQHRDQHNKLLKINADLREELDPMGLRETIARLRREEQEREEGEE